MNLPYILRTRPKIKITFRKIIIALSVMILLVMISYGAYATIMNKPTGSSINKDKASKTMDEKQSILKGKSLYVDPTIAQAGIPPQIASQPLALWLGEWTGDVRAAADTIVTQANSENKIATIVAYNIPDRDCGNHSTGGAKNSTEYREWIGALAEGIGKREVIVIVEPDALAQMTCLNAYKQADRFADISYSVDILAAQTKAFIYIDAGNSGWTDTEEMVTRLEKANVKNARGFSLNVSNFRTSSSNIAYGDKIADKTGKSFIIDTSRNGRGTNGQWCNPRGRALGESPRTNTTGNLDAYLWVKKPGQSDGTCNGGPPAGTWWNEYAQELIANAGL